MSRVIYGHGNRKTSRIDHPFPDRGLPVIPKLPPEQPTVPPGNKAVAICGECGRTVYQMEMYSCMNGRCPVQPRIKMAVSRSVENLCSPSCADGGIGCQCEP